MTGKKAKNPAVGRNNPLRGVNSRRSQATAKTGRAGEDDRTESALRIAGWHSRRATR